ncbi:unnamed protein product [Effrenium voratum]|nr:unnamed protein product [Effrenium voratum]
MVRTPALRKIGCVLALLALLWACQQAVPFARPPAGAWARKPPIARGAASKADGQPGEGDDNEDDEVNNRAAEHDQVQNYSDMEVLTWIRNFFKESKLLDQVVSVLENAGPDGAMLSALVDLNAKEDLLKGAIDVFIEVVSMARGAPAQDRIAMVRRGLGAVGKLARCAMLSALVEMDAVDVMRSALKDPDVQSALLKLAGMNGKMLLTVTQDWLKSLYELKPANAEFVVDAVQGLSDPSALTFADLVNDSSYPEFKYQHVWVYRLLTDIPKCGYIEDAQLLKSTVAGEVVDVAIGKRKGKRCIPVFYGESGSGKTLQSQLAPALKLRNNSCIVRVFSKTIDDDDPILDNIRRLHQQQEIDNRNNLCKTWNLSVLFAQIKGAFWQHEKVVEAWFGNSSRNEQDLGTIVFVIDEISKCIELARGIASVQDEIYLELERYCTSAQLVMAGTAAAYILGTPGKLSSDPLTHVGVVQGTTYLDSLVTHELQKDTGVSLKDLQVASLRPYLSNARTAWFMIEMRHFTWAPKEVSPKSAGSMWKRYPAATGCYVPLMHRATNGLQRLKTAKEREDIANRALKLLMHADLLTPDMMPTLQEAVECVSLGLCNVSNYSQAQGILEQDRQSKTYRDHLISSLHPLWRTCCWQLSMCPR